MIQGIGQTQNINYSPEQHDALRNKITHYLNQIEY